MSCSAALTAIQVQHSRDCSVNTVTPLTVALQCVDLTCLHTQMDLDDEPEARSLATRQGATTAAGWNHSQVFSKGGSQGATLRTAGRQSARTGRTGAGAASRAGTRLVRHCPS